MRGRLLKGIITAPITPLDENGNIDSGATKELCDFLVSSGVHGLFAIGSTGEFPLMSIEERKKAAEIFVKAVDGRIPMVIHIGATKIEDAIELAKHAGTLGVDGIAAVPPYYYKFDEECILQYFTALAAIDPELPFYVYNFPANAKNDISPQLLKRMNEKCNNIVGIKDTTQNYTRYVDYVDVMGSDFCNLIGSDAMILAALIIGGKGAVSASATSFPEPFVKMYEAYQKGDLKEAQKLQLLAARLRTLFATTPFLASRKIALKMRGFNYSTIKRPLRDMTEKEIDDFKKKIAQLEEKFQFKLSTKIC